MKLFTTSYLTQTAQLPQTGRHIVAQYDGTSVVVYQAYRPAIAQIAADTLNFAQLQSAVTSTELIAQLCIRATRAVPAKPRSGIFAW